MNVEELRTLPAGALLRTFAHIIEELRRRGLVRSSNNPVADLSELIAANALGLTLVGKSNAGHDAVDSVGKRYQVKGRRITAQNGSRQLSYVRNLEARPFDFIIGILLNAEFGVMRACLIPYEVVCRRAVFVAKVNGHRFLLRDDVWNEPTVRDLTDEITRAAIDIGLG